MFCYWREKLTLILRSVICTLLSLCPSDNYWVVQHESGLSCAWVAPLSGEGFQADKTRDETHRAGWYETKYWRTTGQSPRYATLFHNTESLDLTSGRYTAPTAGAYMVHMNARIDSGDLYYFRFLT